MGYVVFLKLWLFNKKMVLSRFFLIGKTLIFFWLAIKKIKAFRTWALSYIILCLGMSSAQTSLVYAFAENFWYVRRYPGIFWQKS